MYMSLCQNNHMNYNTFVKSMHNIYQLMNLSDIETLGCDVLIPLCDVLGKEKANANVRSMKIRSKIRSSNDLKNELLANERMIYSLFTNYTKISLKDVAHGQAQNRNGSGPRSKPKAIVGSTTKSTLSFVQLLLMFEDFCLIPNEYDEIQLSNTYRQSLIDCQKGNVSTIDGEEDTIDEESFHYILLSLGSDSTFGIQNNYESTKHINNDNLMRGLQFIVNEFNDCKQGREVFAQRFKITLPVTKKKKKKKKKKHR